MKINSALGQKKDFALEVPGGSPEITARFVRNGYDVKCVYFGLDNIYESN